MRPQLWQPPVDPSPQEQAILKLIKRTKLCIFLRQQRHHISSPYFQQELAQAYHDSKRSHHAAAARNVALIWTMVVHAPAATSLATGTSLIILALLVPSEAVRYQAVARLADYPLPPQFVAGGFVVPPQPAAFSVIIEQAAACAVLPGC